MKVTSVHYSHKYTTIQFENETIGIDIQVDEYDDPESAYVFAKSKVEQWHKENQIAEESKKRLSPEQIAAMQPVHVRVREATTIDPPHPDDTPVVQVGDINYESLINASCSIEGLAKLKQYLPKSLMPNYMNKLKQLTAKI